MSPPELESPIDPIPNTATVLNLADQCELTETLTVLPEGENFASLEGLGDTLSVADVCTSSSADDGPEGFFAVQMSARARIHVRATPSDSDQDIALGFFDSCSGNECLNGRNACPAGVAEESIFEAPVAQVYRVSVESIGSSADVLVSTSRIVCGNGIEEPGEQCDDDNVDGGDGCDSLCRKEMPGEVSFEAEPNDQRFAPNIILPRTGEFTYRVDGEVSSGCDVDRVVFSVAETMQVSAIFRLKEEKPCEDVPDLDMALISRGNSAAADVELAVGSRDVTEGNCIDLNPTLNPAATVEPGSYEIKITRDPDERESIRYRLVLLVRLPPPPPVT